MDRYKYRRLAPIIERKNCLLFKIAVLRFVGLYTINKRFFFFAKGVITYQPTNKYHFTLQHQTIMTSLDFSIRF